MEGTPVGYGPEGLYIGMDNTSAVSPDYRAPFAFGGKVHSVTIAVQKWSSKLTVHDGRELVVTTRVRRRTRQMTRFILYGVGVVLAVATMPAAARGQTPPPASTAPDIEPDAIATLEKMGAYLRTLNIFQVRAATTREDVLTDGEKVQFSSVTDVLVRKPDRFRADVDGDRHTRLYLYDGKVFTLFARRAGYYATVPAPPTIGELADRLDDKYGIEVPLADLFEWGGPKASTKDIAAASDIGPSVVEGVTCEHYVFRQPGVDWQIWIQNGSYPLPRKLVITTMTDEARPQFTAVYTWNLAPSFNDAAFTFDPPDDAKKIVFAEVSAAAGADKK